jgi:N4-gp56 family major capsid protein
MDEVVTNVASGNKRYSGGATDFASLDALTNANGKIVIKDLLGAMTRLTITRAPKPKGGEYVAVVAPQVAYDIMDDPKFVDAGVRGTIKGLFTGELGVWYFTRIVKTTQPWIEETAGGEGVYDSTGDIFSTVVVGREAFGVPNLQGNSPLKPSTIIVNTPDSGNPLNQYVTAGWKAYWTAKVLDDTWFVVLRSRSTYTP